MPHDQTKQTILITGATGTVGSGLAPYFAARGHRVILTARDRTRLDQLSASLKNAPAYTADLSDTDSLESLVAQLQLDEHAIDVLINNAADVTSKPFLETSLEEIDSIVRTNITGTIQLSRLIGADMAVRGRGAIVNISSLAGYKPNPAQTVYSITKGALNVTSEALRAELAPRGVHLVNVALMGVGTEAMKIPVETVAQRIERAIANREPEIFFYRSSKFLMRLYSAFPFLTRR
ncbi:MAG: SDR family NAD(P)-dependent oxidoreductase [Candidatus Hydrogenedentes bacterium]|nr:SDR family NAD(P)-dependent oxidoreductase [Candidatus Hydrogenedentota bacterium]